MKPEDFSIMDDLQYIGHVDSSRNCYIKLKCLPEHVNALRGLEGEIFQVSMMQIQNDGLTTKSEEPPGRLCITAIELCKEVEFQNFMYDILECRVSNLDEENAKASLCEYLGIQSRRQIDSDLGTAKRFAELRTEYRKWLNDNIRVGNI